MKRAMVPELLDSDAGTPEEIKASITDLRMFNRRFGGIRTTRSLLHRIAQQRGLRRIYWLE